VDFIVYLGGDLGVGGGQRGVQVNGHGVILCHCFGDFFLRRRWGGDWGFYWLFEGGCGKRRVFMWCFCGDVMVDCVVFVERRHHGARRLKICHEFEVYFWLGCGKAAHEISVFGNGAPKDSRVSNSFGGWSGRSRYRRRWFGER